LDGQKISYKEDVTNFRDTLRRDLARARTQTDRLFEMLAPEAMYERPIPERHRIVFYLGHFEAFDWNMICATSFGMSSFHPEFDRLFAFGIDPVDGKLPQDRPSDWPAIDDIRSYNRRVRATVDELLERATFKNSTEPFVENGQIFRVVIEHRLMHAETLAYMLHWLPYNLKRPETVEAVYNRPGAHRAPLQFGVRIPAGIATLGQPGNGSRSFGWDNEFETQAVVVPEFSIDAFNITNQQFLEFMSAGGYDDPSSWSDEGWEWLRTAGIRHPKFWIPRGGQWFYRTMFGEIPLPGSFPVYVSHAEAEAYARWAGKTLPTEEQFHRAAFGSQRESEQLYPWGDAEPDPMHGNFGFQSWSAAPVGSFPAGRSAFGVFDLIGNGWEWTSTQFAPFAGFQPFPFYPGYSADFFDGKHFVMKGASPRTAAGLVRRSFRNWFQPHYPNVYATFRCVEN
jgi:iron(II)-dependent oxidoreductase